jgi:hypothetical protein
MNWRQESYSPLSRWGVVFFKKNQTAQLIAFLSTSQNICKYYSVAFRVRRWFVELKMAISKQFK